MTAKNTDPAEPAVAEATGVVDPAVSAGDFVRVVHESDKNGPPGLMSRAYFEGWGKAKGYSEVKSK